MIGRAGPLTLGPTECASSFWLATSSSAARRHDGSINPPAALRMRFGGSVMFWVANYGFSAPFAWVSDRFGVSWPAQLRLGPLTIHGTGLARTGCVAQTFSDRPALSRCF